MSQSNTNRTSFPLLGILGLIFVTLKLIGEISWPWIWVLAPFWGGFAVLIVVVVLIAIAALVGAAVKSKPKPRLRTV